MVVLDAPVKDQELLAAAVNMPRDMAMRCVPDDRGGARYLIADAIQHPPVDAFDRRGDPGKPRGMRRDPLRKIRIDLHGNLARLRLVWRRRRQTSVIGSIRLSSLFLMLPTRALTRQQIIPSEE